MTPSDKIVKLMQSAAPVRPRRRRAATAVRIEGASNIVGNGNVVVSINPQLLRQLSDDIRQLSTLMKGIAAELPRPCAR